MYYTDNGFSYDYEPILLRLSRSDFSVEAKLMLDWQLDASDTFLIYDTEFMDDHFYMIGVTTKF